MRNIINEGLGDLHDLVKYSSIKKSLIIYRIFSYNNFSKFNFIKSWKKI